MLSGLRSEGAPELRGARWMWVEAAGLLRVRVVGMVLRAGLLRVHAPGMAGEVRRRLWVPGLRLMGRVQGLCPAAAGHLCTIR